MQVRSVCVYHFITALSAISVLRQLATSLRSKRSRTSEEFLACCSRENWGECKKSTQGGGRWWVERDSLARPQYG